MSLSEACHPTNGFSTSLAWPIAGGKPRFGSSVGGDADVQALNRLGTKIRVPHGRMIFGEGDPAEHAYKVVSGCVRLSRHISDGRRQVTQFLFPGDFFSFMEFGEHSFTAEAVNDLVLMAFPQKALLKLRNERANVQERFLTLVAQRVLDAHAHLVILGRATAKERVASFLISLSERIGVEDDEILDVPMSRLDIADYLGLTIETVCRVLSELKRARIIDIPDPRHLVLRKIDALQERVEMNV
jgi:CRP-like cAMP-binding protein